MKPNWLWTLVFSVSVWWRHSMKFRLWLLAAHHPQSIHWGQGCKPECISCTSSRPRSSHRGDRSCYSKWKSLLCSPPCEEVRSSSTAHYEGCKIRQQGRPPSPRGLLAGFRQWHRRGLPQWRRSASLEACSDCSYPARCRWRGRKSTQTWSRRYWCNLQIRVFFRRSRSWRGNSGGPPWVLSSATGWRKARSTPQRPAHHQHFALRWQTRGRWMCWGWSGCASGSCCSSESKHWTGGHT